MQGSLSFAHGLLNQVFFSQGKPDQLLNYWIILQIYDPELTCDGLVPHVFRLTKLRKMLVLLYQYSGDILLLLRAWQESQAPDALDQVSVSISSQYLPPLNFFCE